METIYDWLTIGLFAALIVLFLHRSLAEEPSDADPSIFSYLIAGAGCAVTNYLGNNGFDLLAVAALLSTIIYSIFFLRPFKAWPPRA